MWDKRHIVRSPWVLLVFYCSAICGEEKDARNPLRIRLTCLDNNDLLIPLYLGYVSFPPTFTSLPPSHSPSPSPTHPLPPSLLLQVTLYPPPPLFRPFSPTPLLSTPPPPLFPGFDLDRFGFIYVIWDI